MNADVTMDGEIEFLFTSRGTAVAFRDGRDVFDLDLVWLGWTPWNDGDVFDPAGRYLGSITPSGRFYEIGTRRGLTSPPPPRPTRVKHPQPPPDRAPELLPAGMRDVRLPEVADLVALRNAAVTPSAVVEGLPASADAHDAPRPGAEPAHRTRAAMR